MSGEDWELGSAGEADASWGNAWVEANIVERGGRELVILTIIGYADHSGMTSEAHWESFWADADVDVIERLRELKAEADRLDGGWA